MYGRQQGRVRDGHAVLQWHSAVASLLESFCSAEVTRLLQGPLANCLHSGPTFLIAFQYYVT